MNRLSRLSAFDKAALATLLCLALVVGIASWGTGGIGLPDLLGEGNKAASDGKGRSPSLVYIGWDQRDRSQLYQLSPQGGQPKALTGEEHGVGDFAVAPDGSAIAYSARRQDGGTDLVVVDREGRNRRRLLDCSPESCGGLQWSPDGRRLAFERRDNPDAQSGSSGNPQLWWVELASGHSGPILDGADSFAFGLRWSRSGSWISYYSTGLQAVRAYNLEDGRDQVIPSNMEQPAVWNPSGGALLVPQMRQLGDHFGAHLLLADLATGKLVDMSGESQDAEDGFPAWSPDGEWIAFRRRSPPHLLVGGQLWLMRADGSEARPLTSDPMLHHGMPTWSPDGQQITYHRYPVMENRPTPEVWVLETASGNSMKVASPGNQPAWLP